MATNVQVSTHYNGTIKIKFYPDSHRYQLDGRKDFLISVTAVTGLVDKSGVLMAWASKLTKNYLIEALGRGEIIEERIIDEAVNQHKIKKEKAADAGSAVHLWIQEFIDGKNPSIPEDKQVKSGVLAFLKWRKENDIKFIVTEQRIFSQKHNYVGSCDVIFTIGNNPKRFFGDWKTSKGIYPEFWMQIAAYREAYQEEFGGDFGENHLLHFDKETGNFTTHTKKDHEEDFGAFLGLLSAKKWLKKNTVYNKYE